jgi:hypothetical protein
MGTMGRVAFPDDVFPLLRTHTGRKRRQVTIFCSACLEMQEVRSEQERINKHIEQTDKKIKYGVASSGVAGPK